MSNPPRASSFVFNSIITSGTTGKPKGVLYTYRGLYLSALGNAIEAQLSLDSVHLFLVPLFHANSWIFPYAVTAIAGNKEE